MSYGSRCIARVAALLYLICWLGGVLGQLQMMDYIIKSDTLPPDVRFRPPIGNGHVATNVLSDTVYMNGLFNGQEDSSSRARIPAYVSVGVNMTSQESDSREFELNMYHGIFVQRIKTPEMNVNITYYAHRKYTRLLITQIDVSRQQSVSGNVTFTLQSHQGPESNDFGAWVHTHDYKFSIKSQYHMGTVKATEIPGDKKSVIHVYQTTVPEFLELTEEMHHVSVTLIASHSQDKDDALNAFKQAVTNMDELLASHKREWEQLWFEGRIDIRGNNDLSQNIAAATYTILCSVPSEDDPITPFFGVSPGGLSRGGLLVPSMPGGGHNDYAGHVFWDMDTWMMPPIMMLHPHMARRMISSRTRVLDQAKKNAKSAGYKGTKFPWEQATTGIEATPKWAGNMSRYEIHISADIAYGLRQYLYVMDDVNLLLHGRGWELALESARFWQSRVSQRADGKMDILGVMGPDEYHFNIDNSVYTNYNAKLSLMLPSFILEKFKLPKELSDQIKEEIDTFKATAEKIVILFDDKMKYHPQYADFNLTAGQIKQSDVVLLGYPLIMPMSREIRQNDLEYYEQITNPQGPDTGTWSMHTVGWLELGNETRAQKNFNMMFRNINDPFKVFSEKPVTSDSNGGCVNFITAAGGLLQSIIFGYGGIRLYHDRIELNPYLLPGTTSWTLIGLDYRGVVFDITVGQDKMYVALTTKPSGHNVHYQSESEAERIMQYNDMIKSSRGKAKIWLSDVQNDNSNNSAGLIAQSVSTLCLYVLLAVRALIETL